MSYKSVSLNKLLKTIYATKPLRKKWLTSDARKEFNKNNKQTKTTDKKKKGGDYYDPFWRDAKDHIMQKSNLHLTTEIRIKNEKASWKHHYDALKDGFLIWWEQKRKLTNLPFTVIDDNVSGQIIIENAGIIKVEKAIHIKIERSVDRVIYPYFCYQHPLSDEGARIGIWAIQKALKTYDIENIRILDVFRSTSHSAETVSLKGDEGELCRNRYQQLISEWDEIKKSMN